MAKFGSDHWHHSQRWMAGRAANTKPGVMRAVLRQESLLIIFVSIFMPVKCVFSIVACRSHVKGSGKREVGEDGMGGWEDGGWIFYRSDREDRNQYVRPRTARSTQIFPKHDMPRLIAPNSLSGRVKHTNKSYSAGRQLSWRDVIVSLTCRWRIVGDMTTVCMCVYIYIV